MCRIWAVIKYEYKMQIKRGAGWGVLGVVMLIALLDSFPSAKNLARLEFLIQPAYFVSRILSLYGLILSFGIAILISNRFSIDQGTGVKSLLMATRMKRREYVGGKMLAAFMYVFTMSVLFLVLNLGIYAAFTPVKCSATEYLIPLGMGILVSVLPVSIFIGFSAAALPQILGIRLFYVLISLLFMVSAATVGSAEKMPFYLITSGDLIKTIWQHPRYPLTDSSGILTNLLFLISGGVLSLVLMSGKRRFWRAE